MSTGKKSTSTNKTPVQTDNTERPEDGPQDVTQDPLLEEESE